MWGKGTNHTVINMIYKYTALVLFVVLILSNLPSAMAFNSDIAGEEEKKNSINIVPSLNSNVKENPPNQFPLIYDDIDNEVMFYENQFSIYINMKSTRFDPLNSEPEIDSDLKYDASSGYYLVQCFGPSMSSWVWDIQNLGGIILGYIPDFTYLVSMDSATSEKVSKLSFIRWVGIYHPTYKIQEGLLEKKNDLELNVVIFKDKKENYDLVKQELIKIGGTITREEPESSIIGVKIESSKIGEIATISQVEWMDEYTPPVALMNNVREFTQAVLLYPYGFNGTGIVGEVKDNGIDQSHPDFVGQLIATDGNPVDGAHGTSCFGIVFSSGANDQNAMGMIPGGKGVFCDWGVGRKQSISNLVNNWDGVFQSNSWSMVGQNDGTYNSNSRNNDEAVFEYDITMLYAAGNSNDGVYPSSISTDAAAKNIITVGAVYHYNDQNKNNDQWVNWGSGATPAQGPASDGRIKPDLAGVFDWIYTTDSTVYTFDTGQKGYNDNSDYYSNFGGTSGATPIVAGASGLVYQMYKEDFFGNNPLGSLPHASTVKAIMIADAYQYEFVQANRFQQGWGLVDVGNIYDVGKSHFIIDQESNLQTGEQVNYNVAPKFGNPMKISLVWTDVPGTTSSSQHLVNNLDLKVTDPDGNIYWGNYGLDNSKWSSSGGSADTLNNVENVFIENPEPGNWTMEVVAQNVPMDGDTQTPEIDQHYSLVASNVVKFMHDLGVSDLNVSKYLAPGVMTSVSASIYNNGLSDENSILVNFTVDGLVQDSKLISNLGSGNNTNISFDWTPVTGIYMVGIEVEILPDENMTINNFQEKQVIAEPDLAVSDIKAPKYSRPSEDVIVNATITNLAKVDLTNVQVQLLINGTVENITTIPNLPKESFSNVSFIWSPTLEGWFLIEIYALPQVGESLILDNRLNSTILITSQDPIIVAVVDSWGTDFSDEAPWDFLNSNWIDFGSSPILIDYMSLDKEDISYSDLVLSNADVLFISCAYAREFTDSEIDAIANYVMGGVGLIATSATFFQNVPNNNKLTFLFGMRDDFVYDADLTSTLNLTAFGHPLFVNVPDPYTTGSGITALPPDDSWDAGDIVNGTYIAKSDDDMGAIITHKGVVYISHWIEYQSNTDDMQLLYNAMTWSKWQRDLHDISVSDIQVPRYITPGNLISVSATVRNLGLSDEFNLEISFYVNDILDSQTTIPNLASDNKTSVNFLWSTPTVEDVYTLKIEAASLSGENITENNFIETDCIISDGPALGKIGLISDASQLDAITSTLDGLSKSYDSHYDNSVDRHTSDIMLLLQYQVVIFYNHNRRIDSSEQQALNDYIELGGVLIVTGYDSLGAPDDDLLREVVRSTSVGDNMGENSFSVSDEFHPIMNGIFGQFSLGSTYSVSQTDHDNAKADSARSAQTVAELNDGFDKIISTELIMGGKVIYWNGNRNCADWTSAQTEDMFKNLIVWLMPIYNDIAVLSFATPQLAFINESMDITATVINLGLNNSGTFNIQLEVKNSFGSLVHSEIKPVNSLTHMQKINITWQWQTPLSGIHTADITVLVSIDEIPGNNMTSGQFNVYYKFFEDDMENGVGGWDSSASSFTPLWHLTTTESQSPPTSWWCGMSSATQYTVLGEQYLTSSEIDLRDATSSYLTFYQKYSIDDYPLGGDWGLLEINSGSGWATLDSYSEMSANWNQVTIDISSYIGETIEIRFHLHAGVLLTDNGWWVDDVLIYGFANQYGLEISVDFDHAFAGLNELAYYDIYVKNTGNTFSDFDLNLSGSITQNWQAAFSLESFSLLPDTTQAVNLSVIPSQTEAGDYTFSVLGHVGTGGIIKAQRSLDLMITVNPWYGVDIVILDNLKNLMPGETEYFDISIVNNANVYDTFFLQTEGNMFGVSTSWDFSLSQSSIGIDPFSNENVTLSITAPLDGVSGDYVIVNVTGESQGDSSENAKGTTTTQILDFFSLDLQTSPTTKKTVSKTPVEYYLDVSNLGNTPVTVDMDISPFGNWNGWMGLFSHNNFVVDAYSSENVTLIITPPSDLLENEFKEFQVRASTVYNFSLLNIKTEIDRSGDVKIDADETDLSANIGTSVFYHFTVTNTQNNNDTIDIRASSKNGWKVTLFQQDGESELVDTDSDSKPDSGLLEPFDDFVEIVVEVEVPFDALVGAEDIITVTFTSSLPDGNSESIELKARAEPSGSIVIEASSTSESAVPGSQINYWITIKNFFNYDTEIDITLTSEKNWELELLDGDGISAPEDTNQNGIPDSGTLDAFSGTGDVLVVLSIPKNTLAFTKNTITVKASSADFSGGFTSIILNATVNRVYDFEIVRQDDIDLIGKAGEEIEFTVTITNNGNYEEALDLRFGELPFGWRGYFSNREPVIPIEDAKAVTVTLEIPSGADSGEHLVFITGISSDEVESTDLSVSISVEKEEEELPISLILLLLMVVIVVIILAAVASRRKGKKVVERPPQYSSRQPEQYPSPQPSQMAPKVTAVYPVQTPAQKVHTPQPAYSQIVFPRFETISCPACYSSFDVKAGSRPLRVQCPRCGVSGVLH
jgi:uncharacterized membrane protein